MTISPQPKIHQATIYFISDDFEFELETVDAYMYRGAKKHSIEGKAFDGILSFTYEYLIDAAVTNFTYTFNVDFWLNQKITDLKHYNRLAKANKFISKSKDLKICVKLHVQNSEVSLGVGPSSAYESLFERISSIMYLTECSQKIAKQFSRPLRFKTLELSAVEDRMVIRYAEAMDGEVHSTFTPDEEICTAILKDVPDTLMTAMENHDVTAQLRFTDNTTFDFFGNHVTLPKIITDLLNFELNLFSSLHSRDKGALYCIVYAVEGTSSVQYVASDEPYIVHKS